MTPLPRGYCPVCGKAVALRQGGLVREHAPTLGYPVASGRFAVCEGSGRPALHSLAEAARISARLLRERTS